METLDLSAYQNRLIKIIDAALASYEKRHSQSASLRKLAAEIGQPKKFNTLYKWHKDTIKEPIRAESYSLLAAIDPEERTPLELSAHLMGVEVSQLSEQTLSALVTSLHEENAALKKRVAGMYQLATA
jgi:hypothetical protein